jgi:E3 ubiquitin-protein ligase TRIP12
MEQLTPFSESELNKLLCGTSGEIWTLEILRRAVTPAHGYSTTDVTYHNLLQFMVELEGEDQRKFLSFVTGCPRLPVGGIASLTPPLKVVKKDPELSTESPDGYLPSVMTC